MLAPATSLSGSTFMLMKVAIECWKRLKGGVTFTLLIVFVFVVSGEIVVDELEESVRVCTQEIAIGAE